MILLTLNTPQRFRITFGGHKVYVYDRPFFSGSIASPELEYTYTNIFRGMKNVEVIPIYVGF